MNENISFGISIFLICMGIGGCNYLCKKGSQEPIISIKTEAPSDSIDPGIYHK